ncbi:hypothetical protein V2O64_16090 [Verrucomicrobiaceae bacterium 227]
MMTAPTKLLIVIPLTWALAYFAGSKTTPPHTNLPKTPSSRTLREIPRQQNAASRTLAFFDLLDSCQTPDQFRNLIEDIESTADKTEKNRLLATLFSAWLDLDPYAALSEVRHVESLRHHTARLSETFATWAAENPTTAAKLLATALNDTQPIFLHGIDPPDYLLSLVSGLAKDNPQLAAQTLQNANSSSTRTSAIEVLLQDWYPADPTAVQSWANSIADPDTRRTAIETAATKAGQLDNPSDGISWASSLPSPAEKQLALSALTNQWSQRHSAEAFNWTSQLTDESLKLTLMPGVLKNFALIHPGPAADWLNQYEASPAIDPSIVAYAKAIQFTNPAAALESATAITDPNLRQVTIASIQRNQNR